jgi:hypothetical protein
MWHLAHAAVESALEDLPGKVQQEREEHNMEFGEI